MTVTHTHSGQDWDSGACVFGDDILEDIARLQSSSAPLELGNGSGIGITVPGVQCHMSELFRERDRDYAHTHTPILLRGPFLPSFAHYKNKGLAHMTNSMRRPLCSVFLFPRFLDLTLFSPSLLQYVAFSLRFHAPSTTAACSQQSSDSLDVCFTWPPNLSNTISP